MKFITSLAILAAEEGETGGGGAELVLPETSELIAGILAFAIVFFFIWKWALPTINRTLAQRQAAIQGQMEEAERAKSEAESLLGDYRAQLAESKAEGNRIIEQARGTAEQLKGEIVAKAEADAEQIRAKARADAQAEVSRALSEARSRVGDISMDLAGKIVGKTLDADAHEDLINRYLSDLEKL